MAIQNEVSSQGLRLARLALGHQPPQGSTSEIKAAAKSDPVAAGDGAVSLMERIWPAFQDIDTSSGALGTAVARTLAELIPILIDAPADHATRSKWLERLFEAVQNDGVEYLAPVEDRWGEIARYPDLINEYADRLIGMVRRAWTDHATFQHVIGTSICLSSLLEAARYDELAELLAIAKDEVLVLASVRCRGSRPAGAVGSRNRIRGGCAERPKSWLPRNIDRPHLRGPSDPARSFG